MASPTRRADYATDFYSWSLEQARLVRQGRWADLDRDNVAEEIESLVRGQFDKLESAIRQVLIESAAKEMELDEATFPENCVYWFDEIMTRQLVL